jgi:hypothetical protein
MITPRKHQRLKSKYRPLYRKYGKPSKALNFNYMSQSSFEIRTAKDLFLKLVREHERIMADPWSSDHAINFSITAHHLTRIG